MDAVVEQVPGVVSLVVEPEDGSVTSFPTNCDCDKGCDCFDTGPGCFDICDRAPDP